jgi:glycosyltransferase involved in cell wall biosynthesis
VRFFHAASSTVKATDAVLQSLSDLQGRYRFTVDIAQQVPRTDVLRRMQAADVYLDQFALGTYGIAAIEAMAMGKPVVGYVTPEIREMLPGSVPLVSSTQEHLSETLSELLTAPQRLRHLGEASREYAQNHHDARTVAEALADVYRALTDGREPDRWTLWNT